MLFNFLAILGAEWEEGRLQWRNQVGNEQWKHLKRLDYHILQFQVDFMGAMNFENQQWLREWLLLWNNRSGWFWRVKKAGTMLLWCSSISGQVWERGPWSFGTTSIRWTVETSGTTSLWSSFISGWFWEFKNMEWCDGRFLQYSGSDNSGRIGFDVVKFQDCTSVKLLISNQWWI